MKKNKTYHFVRHFIFLLFLSLSNRPSPDFFCALFTPQIGDQIQPPHQPPLGLFSSLTPPSSPSKFPFTDRFTSVRSTAPKPRSPPLCPPKKLYYFRILSLGSGSNRSAHRLTSPINIHNRNSTYHSPSKKKRSAP
ncbi:hypothetical protein F5H01DRAFT_148152 [Linnemannia elongata]|nr:hypothetical protein F5H01DRAFT_148152 [Linnemannia elongata]